MCPCCVLSRSKIMNTLNYKYTNLFFANDNGYNEMIQIWKSLVNDPEERALLTAKDYFVYLVLRGKDYRKGFYPGRHSLMRELPDTLCFISSSYNGGYFLNKCQHLLNKNIDFCTIKKLIGNPEEAYSDEAVDNFKKSFVIQNDTHNQSLLQKIQKIIFKG